MCTLNNMLNRFQVVFLLIAGLSASAQPDTIQHVTANRSNATAQRGKPYVIMISADGFRADYVMKYHASHLQALAIKGATADYMLSSYPSLTFPNHYSLVTGLYPAHHGLVDNTFYDPARKARYEMHDVATVHDGRWYGGTPLWVLAEQQHMLTASFYWVGSDADIAGTRPTYYYNYNEKISIPQRLAVITEWLTLPEDIRPHLLTIYFPQVDHESHDHGPESKETEEAVGLIDRTVGRLAAIADSLQMPINFVFVSDHGMTKVDTEHPVLVPPVLLDTTVCRVYGGSTLVHAYVNDPAKIEWVYRSLPRSDDYRAYLQADIPAAWHYDKINDRFNRVGDIILVTAFGKVFGTPNRKITQGKHGYDPTLDDMHAMFIAWGPNIKPGTKVSPFENVNIYPLVAGLLGLSYDFTIDGKESVLKSIQK